MLGADITLHYGKAKVLSCDFRSQKVASDVLAWVADIFSRMTPKSKTKGGKSKGVAGAKVLRKMKAKRDLDAEKKRTRRVIDYLEKHASDILGFFTEQDSAGTVGLLADVIIAYLQIRCAEETCSPFEKELLTVFGEKGRKASFCKLLIRWFQKKHPTLLCPKTGRKPRRVNLRCIKAP